MAGFRSTSEYTAAVTAMKARARYQTCITAGQHPRCPVTLDSQAPKGHPQHMTLGHIVNVADGGAHLDPANHGPQCEPCNYSASAHRTNAIRRGEHFTLTTSPNWE